MKKGFIITGIIYSMFLLFVMVLLGNLTFQLMASKVTKGKSSGLAYTATEKTFSYTVSAQSYTVPRTGWYKIQLWGASGGGYTSKNWGAGGYVSGDILLNAGDVLYFYLGEAGKEGSRGNGNISRGPGASATINGGGAGGSGSGGATYAFSNYTGGSSGGGATDVRLTSGSWNDTTSLRSRIAVAGGGGGTYGSNMGSNGKPADGSSYDSNQSQGGGLLGSKGEIAPGAVASYLANRAIGGTQKTGGTFGVGGTGPGPTCADYCNGHSGGGGGWYGGAAPTAIPACSCYSLGGGGGSSYISGYAGVNSINASGVHTLNTEYSATKYFINQVMKSGLETIPKPDGTGNMTGGNIGSGVAKISFISIAKPTRINPKLDNVRYIKDCINGNTVNTSNHWVELQAIVNGVNIAKGKTPSYTATAGGTTPYARLTDGDIDTEIYAGTTTTGLQCLSIDLGQTYNLDELAVWHYYKDGRSYNNNTLSVGSTSATGTTSLTNKLIDNATQPETSQGFHFSAYQ